MSEVLPAIETSVSLVERSNASIFFRSLFRSGTGLFGAVMLIIIGASAIFAPLIYPHDPKEQLLSARLTPPLFFGGTADHIFGTDQLGRDLLSRILQGAQVSMFVALSVVLIAGSFGVMMGILAGYRGKLTDTLIMRIADTQLAFPGILLALLMLYALGPSIRLIVVVLSINGWMIHARIARSLVLPLRESDYIEAAEISGAGPVRVMWHHILPNLTSPLLTIGVLEFARIILAEAALSFLGYGVQSPNASWGLIIAQGQNYLTTAWWIVIIPGTIIALTVLSANMFASWLRIYSDPKQRDRLLGWKQPVAKQDQHE